MLIKMTSVATYKLGLWIIIKAFFRLFSSGLFLAFIHAGHFAHTPTYKVQHDSSYRIKRHVSL